MASWKKHASEEKWGHKARQEEEDHLRRKEREIEFQKWNSQHGQIDVALFKEGKADQGQALDLPSESHCPPSRYTYFLLVSEVLDTRLASGTSRWTQPDKSTNDRQKSVK